MNDTLGPDDAARALDEIGRRQTQVIDLAALPPWYWWTMGALMVVLGWGVDVRTTTSVTVGAVVFAVGVSAATARVTFGPARRARLRNDLLGPAGVLSILGFVAAVVGVSLGLAFALRAAGAGYPATIGCAAGGLLMGLGGPPLAGRLRRIMLARRDGVAR